MFNNKSTFGTNTFGSSSFGNTSTPFGQGTSAFSVNKPIGSAFGTQPFGATQNNTSIFSSATPSTSGVFGASSNASTFGQQSSGFGFGSANQGNVFSATPQTASTSLFSNTASTAFGTTQKPAFGGFGSSSGTSLFGQTQTQTQQQPQSLFNQNTTGGSLFGNTAFGSTGVNTSGTVIKFTPVLGNDTMMKNGVSTNINTRHQCITVMKEYENKSLEELRTDDYLANRKGPAQGTTIGGFGTGAQTSLFNTPTSTANASTGLFGANQNKSFFGSTTTNTGFGTTPTTSLFGQQNQTTSPFNKPISFGTPTTSANTSFSFGNSTSGGFGTQQNKPLFGSTNTIQTTGGGLFGATPAQQTNTGFGTTAFNTGFGAQTQNTSPFAAKPLMFGSTTPASSTGFSFGSNTATNTGSSFMFNSKPATTGFGAGFGTTNTGFGGLGTTSNANTSLFGQNKSQFNFGSTFGNTSLGTASTSLFGSTANKPTGLNLTTGFGSTNTTGFGTNNTGFNFGGSTTTSNTDQNASILSQQQSPAHLMAQQQLLSLSASPYGDSPLFRNLWQNPKKDELLKPTNPQAQKDLITTNHKVTPKSSVKLKLQALVPSNRGKLSILSGDEDEENDPLSGSFLPKKSVKKLVLKSRPLLNNSVSKPNSSNEEHEQANVETSPSISRMIPLNLTSINDSDLGNTSVESPFNYRSSTYILKESSNQRPEPNLLKSSHPDSSMSDLNFMSSSNSQAKSNSLIQNSSLSTNSDESEVINVEKSPHPAGIVLQRSDYYTIPSLNELANMVDEDGNCFVENFSVGREGYGNVFFPGITNVANLNLDELVYFRRKEVIIYTTDEMKPPIGQGLNKKAQVTLDCVWPNDKTSRTPIKSPERLKLINYQEKLEKATTSMGAKFKEYRPETGSWVFQVDHFSKYGLNDSDDEDIPATLPPTELLQKQQAQLRQSSFGETRAPLAELINQWDTDEKEQASEVLSVPLRLRGHQEDEEMEAIVDQPYLDKTNDSMHLDKSMIPASHRLVEVVGANTQRVQAMKATLFWSDADDQEMVEDKVSKQLEHPYDYLREKDGIFSPVRKSAKMDILQKPKVAHYSTLTPKRSVSSSTTDTLSKYAIIKGSGACIEETPRLNIKKTKESPVALRESIVADKTCLSDCSSLMGRTFRVGWAPKLIISNVGNSLSHIQPLSTTARLFQPFAIADNSIASSTINVRPYCTRLESVLALPGLAELDRVDKTHLLETLECQLKLTRIDIENGIPLAITDSGINILHEHANISKAQSSNTDVGHSSYNFLQHCKSTWSLAVALWGKLDDDSIDEKNNYNYHMARREAFSKWLSATCKTEVVKEIERLPNDVLGQIASIFSYLSALQVNDAAHLALKSKNCRLSLLLTQTCVDNRETLRQQIEHWKESKADKYINPVLLKIYVILAGILVWKSSDSIINACDNIEWIRALALHLWFSSSPIATIADVLKEYDDAYQGNSSFGRYASPPRPHYLRKQKTKEEESDKMLFDTCYHLMKLFADRSHRLDLLLSPCTYTQDPLDYRLSWFLGQALKAIGYNHISDLHDSILNENFSSQLISAGLWQWAVFVSLHHTNSTRRKSSIQSILMRYCSKTSLTKEIEEFLTEKLKIPEEWLFEAKSVRARRDGDVHAEAYYLSKCGQYHASHKLITREIASDAIINENYDYLKSLLKEMSTPDRSSRILDWAIGGQVYLDYLHLSQTVDRILKGELSAYELESLQPEVTSLCNRIGNLQCYTVKDRLCVSEMAKKTANILRAVVSLGSGLSTIPSRLSAPLISKLPLPEDYGAQEFNGLTHSYFLEMT